MLSLRQPGRSLLARSLARLPILCSGAMGVGGPVDEAAGAVARGFGAPDGDRVDHRAASFTATRHRSASAPARAADAVLRGLSNEIQQVVFGIEVAQLERRRRDSGRRAGPTARGRDRVQVGDSAAEVDLDGRGSREALMRPQPGQRESALEVASQERWPRAKAHDRLEGPEEALDDGDRAAATRAKLGRPPRPRRAGDRPRGDGARHPLARRAGPISPGSHASTRAGCGRGLHSQRRRSARSATAKVVRRGSPTPPSGTARRGGWRRCRG
jgi:hypothetical protein